MPGTFDATAGFGTGSELLGTPRGLPNQRLSELTPELDVGELSSRRNPGDLVSTEEPDAQWAIRQLSREKPKVELWRTEGRRANAFFDGDQISDADKSVMEASGRPTITLNDTRRFIKIVDGIERRVPLSVFYVARNPEDVRAQFKAEMRTKAKEWAYDTCLVGDTRVRGGGVHGCSERVYTGKIVCLELANGKTLSGTPNHPVLTISGWKALGSIHEGDYLVDARLLKVLGLVEHFDHAETSIEDAARSLKRRCASKDMRVSLTVPDDFHGDGSGSKVHVISSDGFLRNNVASNHQGRMQRFFGGILSIDRIGLLAIKRKLMTIRRPVGGPAGCVRQFSVLAAISQLISRLFQAATDLPFSYPATIGDGGRGQPFFDVHPDEGLDIETRGGVSSITDSFPGAAHLISGRSQSESNAGEVEAGFSRDLDSRQLLLEIESGEICRRDLRGMDATVVVSEITSSHETRPVYNLDTEEGFYLASGVIVHNCGAVFEIARAKHDRNVTGMGWTESFISRANNPAGILEIRRFSPFEAIFPSCSRENLLGTKWRARKRKMPVEAAIQKWPRVADILRSAAGGEGAPKNYPVKADLVRYRVPWIMTEPTNKGGDVPPNPEEVSVTDFQYTKATEGYFFKDIDGQYDWLPTRKFNLYSKRVAVATGDLPKNAEKVIKDVHWRLFLLSDSFVLDEPSEMPIDGFSLNCITGDWDEKRKLWYGMVRLFIDPQLLVDKLASSAVEIIGAQTKGGIDVEIGAMSEPQAAEYRKTASTPGAVNWFKRNALAENRTRPKAAPAVPEGTIALLQFGMQAMQTLSGLTESLLAPGDSSGVGLRQRLSMGLLLLADYFDSSARFEREQADMTQKFMALIADDRWVRIGGPGSEQAVRLAKDDFDDMLDTTIDDTEQDPTLRRLYMDKITELAPVLIKTNNFIPELLDWFLLPVQFREKLKQAIKNNAQQQMQMKMQGLGSGRGKSRTPDEVKADTMKVQGQAALSFAKAQHLKAQADNLGKQALSSDLKDIMDALIGAHKADLEERKHAHQTGIDRVQAGTALYSAVNSNRGGGQ